jgi:hypothetical protein
VPVIITVVMSGARAEQLFLTLGTVAPQRAIRREEIKDQQRRLSWFDGAGLSSGAGGGLAIGPFGRDVLRRRRRARRDGGPQWPAAT